MTAQPNQQRRLLDPLWVLVAVNLAPLVGVFLFDWDAFRLIALFWLENLFIGALGIVRVVRAGPTSLFEPFFFIVHYGLFCMAHGLILVELLGPDTPGAEIPDQIAYLFHYLGETDVALVAAAIVCSHLWSYFLNFEGRGEYQRLGAREAMALPYRRVMITHIGLIAGAFLLQRFGEPVTGLVALIAVKILLDVAAHRREHATLGPNL